MTRRMKVVRIARPGPISHLQIDEVEVPKPGPDEVLIRNTYAGVNFIDTCQRAGTCPMSMPYTLGVDGAGIVQEVGSAVPPGPLTLGSRVAYIAVGGGAYAEFVSVPVNHVALVPDGLDLPTATAAMVQGMTAVALATQAYPVAAGDWVLVHAAAGGAGQLITQMAVQAGAHVICVTSTPEKAEFAKSLGAAHVLLSGAPDLGQEVLRLTGGRGVHAVFDGVGAATWDTSRHVLRHLGFMVSFGNASGKVAPIDLSCLTPHNIRLTCPSMFEFVQASPTAFADLARKTLGLIQSGKLKIHVHHVYPLSEAARAHEDLEGRRTTGKIVLEVTPTQTRAGC